MSNQPSNIPDKDIRILAISNNAKFALRFNQAGYDQIDIVENCRRAVEKLEDQQYNLIATNNIGDFLRETETMRERDQKKLRDMPLLVFGDRSKQTVLNVIRSGATDMVMNRIYPAQLHKRIEHLLTTEIPNRDLPEDFIDLLPKTIHPDHIDILLWPDSSEEMEKLKSDLKTAKITEAKKSKGFLSNKEIDKLLQATKIKTTETSKDPTKSGKPIITYDYRHPQRVSKMQMRTLENLHSNLARMLSQSYSTIQRSIVDCDIAFIDQTTYGEFIQSLSNPSCSYTFTIEPLSGPAIFDFSLPIVNAFIDRQFGGDGSHPPPTARPLTYIERTIMGRIVTRTLADFETAWNPLIKIRVSDTELETNPEFMQVAAPSDTVILIAFEINSQHTSGLITLCIPYFTLEPVMAYLNPQTWASREHRERQTQWSQRQQKRLNQLKGIQTNITAIWGRGSLTAEEVADLQEGDTLVLNTRTDDPSIVFVENRPLFLAKPGITKRKNHAVEITRALSEEEVRLYL